MEAYVLRTVSQAITEIAENVTAGAVEIAEQGADVLLRCVRTCTQDTVEAFRQDVLQVGLELIQTQPAMAPLVNLVNETLWRVQDCESVADLSAAIEHVAREFKRRLQVHEVAIAEAALAVLPEGATILTNSRSSTVRATLYHAQRAGRRFKVICAEGRPGCEGRTLASELAEHGIPVTLMVDALAVARVARVQLVLIGADHLTVSGLVNKAGTSALAVMARAHKVPIYALCSSEKFLPPSYLPPPQVARPGEQVWDAAPPRVKVENYYFDRTPLAQLSGIITERGVLTTAGIEGWLASIRLHPALSVRREP